MSETLIPLAYREITSFSIEIPRLSRLGTAIGSNRPLRSRGLPLLLLVTDFFHIPNEHPFHLQAISPVLGHVIASGTYLHQLLS